MRKEIKKKVADHMRKFPGFNFPPEMEENAELRVFDRPLPLTDEEGEILLHLMPFFESAEEIAERAGRDKKDIIPLLDSLVKKLWAFCEGTDENRKYEAHTCQLEFYMPWIKPETWFELFAPYTPRPMEEGSREYELSRRSIGTEDDEFLPYLRVIPRESALPKDSDILPEETVSYIINEFGDKGLATAECLCRKLRGTMGGECALEGPVAQCIFLHPFAQAAIEAGVAEPITKEEAFKLVDRARELGLVHQGATAKQSRILCSCCPDCCPALMSLIGGVQQYSGSTKTNFYSQVKPGACQRSLDCVKRCPAKAITFDKATNSATVNIEKCIGCGICVESCPHDAIELKRKEKILELPETNEDHWEVVARQQGRMELYQQKNKG